MCTHGRAGDHHDVARACVPHRRQDELRHRERAERVGAKHALDLGRIGLGHRLTPDAMPALFTRMSTGPKSASTPSTIARTLVVVVDRRHVRAARTAELLDLGDRFLGGIFVAPVVDRDVGAVCGEPERDRAADAPAAAGDERDPSFQSHGLCSCSICVSSGIIRRGTRAAASPRRRPWPRPGRP